MIDKDHLNLDLKAGKTSSIPEQNKDLFLFLRDNPKEKVYYFNSGLCYKIFHEVFKNDNIIVFKPKYNHIKPLSLINFLISQYINMYKDAFAIIKLPRLFVFHDDFSFEVFENKD